MCCVNWEASTPSYWHGRSGRVEPPWPPAFRSPPEIPLSSAHPLSKQTNKQTKWKTCMHVPRGACWDSGVSATRFPLPRPHSSPSLQGGSRISYLLLSSTWKMFYQRAQDLKAVNHFFSCSCGTDEQAENKAGGGGVERTGLYRS